MFKEYTNSVFLNCPFDEGYSSIFDAVVFCVFDSGFIPRCALEIDDSAEVRIDKIFRIIGECKFAVHDISRTALDPGTGLPRFNMPLELGMFLGARRFGGDHHSDKSCLIMDTERFRFQLFISDIAGQDIKAHADEAKKAVRVVREWLNAASGRKTVPGGAKIWSDYMDYRDALPDICEQAGLTTEEMTFNDKANFTSEWLQA